jgi:hypothetical protein
MDRSIPYMGAHFALTAIDVLRKSTDIVLRGHVAEDHGCASHPPIGQRIQAIEGFYRREIGEQAPERALDDPRLPSQTLELLWKHGVGRLEEAHRQGKRLHPVWMTAV